MTLTQLIFFLVVAFVSLPYPVLADKVYQSQTDFIDEVFQNDPPSPSVIAIVGDTREVAKDILDHPPPMLRIRYWKRASRSAWILEEIGKTKPITAGIIVQDGRIEDVRVLIYRESHGAEVRHSFFTKQFKGAVLKDAHELSNTVDGISGATLSVYAMKKLAALALYLESKTQDE